MVDDARNSSTSKWFRPRNLQISNVGRSKKVLRIVCKSLMNDNNRFHVHLRLIEAEVGLRGNPFWTDLSARYLQRRWFLASILFPRDASFRKFFPASTKKNISFLVHRNPKEIFRNVKIWDFWKIFNIFVYSIKLENFCFCHRYCRW